MDDTSIQFDDEVWECPRPHLGVLLQRLIDFMQSIYEQSGSETQTIDDRTFMSILEQLRPESKYGSYAKKGFVQARRIAIQIAAPQDKRCDVSAHLKFWKTLSDGGYIPERKPFRWRRSSDPDANEEYCFRSIRVDFDTQTGQFCYIGRSTSEDKYGVSVAD